MMNMMHLLLEQQNKMSHDMNNRFDVNDVKLNEQNSKLNELSNDNIKFEINMNKRLNEIYERFHTITEQVIESVNEQFQERINEVKDNMESKINECKQNTVVQIEEVRKNIQIYENNTNLKFNAIENKCKLEIQSIQDNVDVMNKHLSLIHI